MGGQNRLRYVEPGDSSTEFITQVTSGLFGFPAGNTLSDANIKQLVDMRIKNSNNPIFSRPVNVMFSSGVDK